MTISANEARAIAKEAFIYGPLVDRLNGKWKAPPLQRVDTGELQKAG